MKTERRINKQKEFMQVLAILVLLFSFLFFVGVVFLPIPKSGERNADLILGALLGTGFNAILQYYFGSSKSSSDKREALAGKPADKEQTESTTTTKTKTETTSP